MSRSAGLKPPPPLLLVTVAHRTLSPCIGNVSALVQFVFEQPTATVSFGPVRPEGEREREGKRERER